MEIGNQCDADSEFRARMRFHQSWWRANVLRVADGTGPTRTSTTTYGNMLDGAAAREAKNFLNDAVRAAYRERAKQGSGVERFRCERNMLSSQPMGFNLFGPLVIVQSWHRL